MGMFEVKILIVEYNCGRDNWGGVEIKIVGSEEVEERRIRIVKWIIFVDVENIKKDDFIGGVKECY